MGILDAPPVTNGRAMRVSDLTYPLVIAHRGAANLFPENTLTAYESSLALGCTAIEAGDLQAAADASIVCIHDSTVDRTTTNSGNVNAFPLPAYRRMVADASSWHGGGWPDTTVPMFDDVLRTIGGHAVIVPEVKDQLDATATTICARLRTLGLHKSAILASVQITNLAIAATYGIAAMLQCPTIASVPSTATLLANGVTFVSLDHSATGNQSTLAATLHAAGIKLFSYTVDHQSEYDTVLANGLDGAYSNDPIYITRNYGAYRKAKTSWHTAGTWVHGMVTPGDGPFTTSTRGNIVGSLGTARWQPTAYRVVTPGEVCPVDNPASSTYVVTTVLAFDALPGNTSLGACIFVAAPNDSTAPITNNVPSSYLVKMRGTGVVQTWAIDAAGAATSKGTLACTAPSIPTLSAGLASGAAVTSIPVNALTVALKVGHQFYLPTGQAVTLTAAAAASATSLAVTSVTPSAAVASGANLIPRITIRITVSPTTITVTRVDESSIGSTVVSDTTNRGAYIFLQNAVDAGTGFTSFESVTMS